MQDLRKIVTNLQAHVTTLQKSFDDLKKEVRKKGKRVGQIISNYV